MSFHSLNHIWFSHIFSLISALILVKVTQRLSKSLLWTHKHCQGTGYVLLLISNIVFRELTTELIFLLKWKIKHLFVAKIDQTGCFVFKFNKRKYLWFVHVSQLFTSSSYHQQMLLTCLWGLQIPVWQKKKDRIMATVSRTASINTC